MRDDPINSTWLYEKLRPLVKLNDQVNMTTLNATNYYRRLEQQYAEDNLPALQRKQRAFKIFREKMDELLKTIRQRREGQKECEEVKVALEKRYSAIQAKVKVLKKAQSEAENLDQLAPPPTIARDRSSRTADQQLLHEQIEEELLGITDHLKRYANDINQNLKQDTSLLEVINKSQDTNASALKRSTDTMKAMMKNPQLGFFQLLFMAGVSIAAFFVTSMFIIIV